ncbi:NAD(P)H-dependent FMN reductase [Nocardioides thalensis]|uniref:NAD(P)H-dependent FMN reductase n=1 Tax=Nocardioides thalensis TaxID=1914755 RepID=A0A853C6L3_9ACTN|nr:NAD(P)H-dependent oxidoreductase [Nocardioides thalensis]NYJ03505.1 NAD(P)H-dependent FMN reductase [Nocardioides thalensis]
MTTSTPKIAIILGSTRPERKGLAVADWVMKQAASRPATYELIDLRDHPLPLLDEPIPPSMGQYQNEHTKAWAEVIAPYDGYVFVTPEYNHATSGVLKNAIDYLYAEWNNKACAFVGYGSLGGARAIENLRAIASELQMAHVRQQVSLSLYTDFENFTDLAPAEQHDEAVQTMFEQLESWATALRTVRA